MFLMRLTLSRPTFTRTNTVSYMLTTCIVYVIHYPTSYNHRPITPLVDTTSGRKEQSIIAQLSHSSASFVRRVSSGGNEQTHSMHLLPVKFR